MAGHSKWANIQYRKGRQDDKRGKIFLKLAKEITVATRLMGANVDFNPRLRLVLEKARLSNMPKDNIERAIKKGTGELEGIEYQEIRYEGYGVKGTAFIVDVVTDNKNRSAASVRSNFFRNGGNLSESGAVSFLFIKTGLVVIPNKDFDIVFEKVIDIANDVIQKDDEIHILCDISKLDELNKVFDNVISADIVMYPKNEIEIAEIEDAKQVLKLYEALEENEDVQEIYSNFNISNEILKELL